MKKYFAYTRVSTARQGTHGVSLQEQKSAIELHAQRHGLHITQWFEEKVTAAKTGRAEFDQIIKRLRKGEADGFIVHKIDRSARNLKDWAALGELIDAGIDVQIASESYDLFSRGGRLSADIQAVVASDYIRNLREEAQKGMHGRLKQGFYPLKAPVGYVDNGGGKLKTIDPISGPFVKQIFEMYDSGQYSIRTLDEKIYQLGLRSHNGGRVGKNGISRILNEPFYYGLIKIKTTGKCYSGKHETLITKALFDRVQARLAGKHRTKKFRHEFAFRKVFRCRECDYSMVGERHRSRTYYRCHTLSCPVTTAREDYLISKIDYLLQPLRDNPELVEKVQHQLEQDRNPDSPDPYAIAKTLQLRLTKEKTRREKLLDVYIDGGVSEEIYHQKNEVIAAEIEKLEAQAADIGQQYDNVAKFLDAATGLISSYISSPDEFRGELLKSVSSTPTISSKNVDIPIDLPWSLFVLGQNVPYCGGYRDTTRKNMTVEHNLEKSQQKQIAQDILDHLLEHFGIDGGKASTNQLQ